MRHRRRRIGPRTLRSNNKSKTSTIIIHTMVGSNNATGDSTNMMKTKAIIKHKKHTANNNKKNSTTTNHASNADTKDITSATTKKTDTNITSKNDTPNHRMTTNIMITRIAYHLTTNDKATKKNTSTNYTNITTNARNRMYSDVLRLLISILRIIRT
eukprot:3736641-Pyramimonas_sp.AAC.1